MVTSAPVPPELAGPPPAGRPARTTAREERSFEREVERATERAGGAEAREARRAELRAAHRAERREGFGAHAARRAPRVADQPPTEPADPPGPPASPLGPLAPVPGAPHVAEGRTAPAEAAPEPTPAGPRDGGGIAAPPAHPSRAEAQPAVAGRGTNGPSAGTPGVPAAGAGKSPGAQLGTGTGTLAGAPQSPGAKATRAPAEAHQARPAPPEPPAEAHELLRQVRLHLAGGAREASLSLVPAHLGRLQIKLVIAGGKVDAVVRAESPEALELFERHLPELREALARDGLGSGELRLELGLQADHGRGGREPAGARSDWPAVADDHASGGDRRLAQLLKRLSPSGDGVDTYA